MQCVARTPDGEMVAGDDVNAYPNATMRVGIVIGGSVRQHD